jgi:polysaccharide biosynthesis/export protein ExoF
MTRSTLIKHFLGLLAMFCCILGSAAVAGADEYLVRAEDKLRIRIFQFPELAGEYTVSTKGTILIPPIGEISVAGSSSIDISGKISQSFIKAGISDKPGATVEVLQSRPIYVVGDVQRPGEYPYRPGVTVLHAISLAGGWFRVNDPSLLRLDREAITIKGDLRRLVRQYYQLAAQRARLNAELGLRTDIAFSADLTKKGQEDPAVAEVMNEEQSLLNINVDQLTKQIDSLTQTRKLYEQEIEAVTRQIRASQTQWKSVETELNEVKALVGRGLTTNIRRMSLERFLSQIEMAEQGYQTLILRARQNISQTEQKIFDLKSDRDKRLTADLQRTQHEIEEVAMRVDTSQGLMQEVQFVGPRLTSGVSEAIEGRSLTIGRVQDGKSITIEAEENTELWPGDVIKVEKSVVPIGTATYEIPGHKLIKPAAARN